MTRGDATPRVLERSAKLAAVADEPAGAGVTQVDVQRLMPWLRRIAEVNRRVLLGVRPGLFARVRPRRSDLRFDASDGSWKTAFNAIAATYLHRLDGSEQELHALACYFQKHIDGDGRWLTSIERVDQAMKGYALLYLAEQTTEERYSRAADALAGALLSGSARAADGSLPYLPGGQLMLVDTLAMICPFLAAYARRFQREDALDLAVRQLRQFIVHAVDQESHLPYHGYYANGAKRLGLQGWGRGTGWYLVGLVDTLAELPAEHPDREILSRALAAAADTLASLQCPDGHWHWVVLHHLDMPDSSVTSLVGYGLARALSAGLLDPRLRATVDSALGALMNVTRCDGVLDGSSAECEGLGKYPQHYSPAPWLQGAATAGASVYAPSV